MFTASDFLSGVILPAAVTGLLLLLGWRAARHRQSARDSRSWAGPIAVAAGFIAGYLALFGWPGFPPHEAIDWLVFLAVPLAAVGIVDSYNRIPPPGRVLLISVATPLSLLLLAWPVLVGNAQKDPALHLIVATALAAISLIALDVLAARTSAGRLSALLLAAAIPTGIVLGLSGSARLGMIGTLLAATQLGAVAAHVVLGRAGLGRGIVLVVGTLLAGLIWCGYLYSELRGGDALLLAAAPNAAWLGRWAPRRYGWLIHVAAQMAAVMAIGAIAVISAWLRYQAAS